MISCVQALFVLRYAGGPVRYHEPVLTMRVPPRHCQGDDPVAVLRSAAQAMDGPLQMLGEVTAEFAPVLAPAIARDCDQGMTLHLGVHIFGPDAHVLDPTALPHPGIPAGLWVPAVQAALVAHPVQPGLLDLGDFAVSGAPAMS